MNIVQFIKDALPNNKFVRNVSVLTGGTTIGQAVLIAASPVLTRLYTPEDFGLLAVFSSLLLTIGVVANLRYQHAIPLPKTEIAAIHILVLCFFVAVSMVTFVAIILLFTGIPIAESLNTPALIPHLWLLPIGILVIGIYQVFNFWAVRTQAFSDIAITKLFQPIAMTGIQLTASPLGAVALLIGQVAGQGAGAGTLARRTLRGKGPLLRRVRFNRVLWAAKRYKKFPLYSSWEAIFNRAGTHLPPLMLAALFNPSIAGIYLLAHRVLDAPLKLIGESIGRVFLSQAPDAWRDGSLGALVYLVHSQLANFALAPMLVVAITGPDIFVLVFGSQWGASGQLARLMTPWIYLLFLTAPLSILFSTLEKQVHGMIFHSILFTSRITSLVFGSIFFDELITIFLFSIVSALCYAFLLVWITVSSGSAIKFSFKPTANALPVSFLLILPVFITTFYFDSRYEWLLGLTTTSILIALHYIRLFRKAY